MTNERCIRSVGVYTPALRIDAESFADAWGRFDAPGIESKAVPDADEDVLTMAAAAGRRTLNAADLDGSEIEWLGFGTTTPPLAEESLTPRLASMLGVFSVLRSFTGSTRAGTQALLSAPPTETSLVIAADCPRGEPDSEREHAAGAGAAAFVVGPDGSATITDHGEHATPYPGTRFRRAGSERVEGIDVGAYERKAFTETLSKAAASVATENTTAAAVHAPNGKRPYRATAALDVDPGTIGACATVHELGDTGAAGVPLSIARALADNHETVLAASFGGGVAADVLRIEVSKTVPSDCAFSGTQTLTYPAYLRRRGAITTPGVDTGAAYVSVPTWQRSCPQRHRLVAGRCPSCGALTFPPEGACSGCRALVEYESIELWSSGTIETVTTIGRGGAPPEFSQQQAQAGAFGVAIVRLKQGEQTVSLPAQLTGEAGVGETVFPVIRHVYTQEGVPRYGVKFTPKSDSR